MGLINLLFFFSLVESVLFLFSNHNYSYWVIIATALIFPWTLYKGLSLPKIVLHKLPNESLKGLKLVQISDLHIGMLHLNSVWLEKVANLINTANADIIAITGDLVEGHYNDIAPQLNVLKKITTPNKFFITGNHEYIHATGPWETKLEEIGFTSLHNQSTVLDYNSAKILIAGVPDRMVSRFNKIQTSQPDKALKTDSQVAYKILLAHQPSSIFDLKEESCDLILSGHTHGGQIFPFHFFVRLVQPVVSGFKTINNIKVFAHQGTGFWGPPMRWFSRSEIVVFEWY